jgi:hypothetical protein
MASASRTGHACDQVSAHRAAADAASTSVIQPPNDHGLPEGVQECPSSTRAANTDDHARLSGRSHRSLGHLPLVRREGRQDFILLPRGDLEVIERAPQLGGDLIELLGRDVELAVGLFQPEGGAPRLRGSEREGSPATLQTHSVRMNFSPGSLSSSSICHSRSAGFFDAWPTIGFLTTASLKWSTTAAMANTPPNRLYRVGSAVMDPLPHGSNYRSG